MNEYQERRLKEIARLNRCIFDALINLESANISPNCISLAVIKLKEALLVSETLQLILTLGDDNEK